jgi:hypothetical protein
MQAIALPEPKRSILILTQSSLNMPSAPKVYSKFWLIIPPNSYVFDVVVPSIILILQWPPLPAIQWHPSHCLLPFLRLSWADCTVQSWTPHIICSPKKIIAISGSTSANMARVFISYSFVRYAKQWEHLDYKRKSLIVNKHYLILCKPYFQKYYE